DDAVGLVLAGRVLRGEAGVGLLAGLVPGIEVLAHVGEAALLLGAGAHPPARGGDGRQAGLLRVAADPAGAGRGRLGRVIGHGAAVDRDRAGRAVAGAVTGAAVAGVPAEPDDDGDHAGGGEDDGQAAAEAAAAVEVAGPAPRPGGGGDAPSVGFAVRVGSGLVAHD